MSYCSVKAGKVLIEEKTMGSCLFVLKCGSVQVVVNNKPINVMKSPVAFGERALISDFFRLARIKTLENCYVYVLEKDKSVKLFNQLRREFGTVERRKILENSNTFSN